jgi:hypothetical protein
MLTLEGREGGAASTTELDSLGRQVHTWTVAAELESCGASKCSPALQLEQETHYDFLGRVTRVTRPWMSGDSLTGKTKLKGGSVRAKGSLTLTKRVDQTPSEPPVTCNSDFFTGQVMGSVLTICAACHVPGGAAEHTAFRVTTGDPIATQASVALHVDMANPDNSRILQKPLAILPHAGGQRLVAQVAPRSGRRQVGLVAAGKQCEGPADTPLVPLRPTNPFARP